MRNQTVEEFLLVGFDVHSQLKCPLFLLFLVIYIITLAGNLVIIVLVYVHVHLHCPMFIFLGNLSLSDILFTTNIVPKMLSIILGEGGTLSFHGCLSQFYFYASVGSTECFLLTVMSYDRYLAICHPLHYNVIMNARLQKCLLVLSWLPVSIVTLVRIILIHQLDFCGPNVIDHFFCDLDPILQLSCSDTSIIENEVLAASVHVILLPFLFIVTTYARIILAIVRIPSIHGRQKTFSTCSSHLIVVCTYFLTLITVYGIPSKAHSSAATKLRSLLYIVLTPMFNPIVYSLRNKEIRYIKAALHKLPPL
uniref:Olfactory receptor n=1 Tax=Xenopus tropicalis TaxID=8364 RepID=A0A803JH57_XENTR